jgi:Rrf2 family protein
VRVSAKADYAIRAAAELASSDGEPIKGEHLAEAQDIPLQFLEQILLELKKAGIVRTRRGAKGGYWLAKPASEVNLAEVIRAVEAGPGVSDPRPDRVGRSPRGGHIAGPSR